MRAATAAACALVLAAAPAQALVEVEGEDASFRWVASARTFTLFMQPVDGGDAEAVVLERLRLSVLARFVDALELEAAWDVVPLVSVGGAGTALVAGLVTPPRSPLRLWDFDATLTAERNFVVRHDLDRLSLGLELEALDVRLGRQAIGHGTSRIFNVSDIAGPFSTVSLDTEYKRGVDALRITVPIGEWMEAEAIAVGHEANLADGVYLGRWRGTISPVDLSVLAGASYGEPTFALDVAANVSGTGVYAEAVVRVPVDGGRSVEDTVRATLGADTYFEEGVTLTVEAHYNGPGVHGADDFAAALGTLEAQVGEATLLGTWYTGASVGWEVTPLLRSQLLWLANWDDPSSLLAPSLSYDFSQESVVALGALVGLGRGLEERQVLPGVTVKVPRSELGSAPYTVWAEVRLYF